MIHINKITYDLLVEYTRAHHPRPVCCLLYDNYETILKFRELRSESQLLIDMRGIYYPIGKIGLPDAIFHNHPMGMATPTMKDMMLIRFSELLLDAKNLIMAEDFRLRAYTWNGKIREIEVKIE